MLWDEYDLLILDLDGVLYIGEDPVPHAIDSINKVAQEVEICAATNNASRSAHDVAEHLRKLGLNIDDGQVFTSAEAAAALLVEQVPEGSKVLAVGGNGVKQALEERGFEVLKAPHHHLGGSDLVSDVVAVVQGHGTENNWWDFNLAMRCIENGAIWIATNPDLTVPIPGGLAPGNGAFVRMLAELTGISPTIAGKPEQPLFEKAATKFKATNPLVIGDRIDTDIAGAVAAGFDSILVETGVHKRSDITTTLPTYVSKDLRDLLATYPDALKVR